MQLFPAMSDRCPNGPPSNANVAANATNCLVGLLESAWKEAKTHRGAGSGFHHVAAFVSVLDDGHMGATNAWLHFAARHKKVAVGSHASMRLLGSKIEMADLAASAGQWASFFPITYAKPDDAHFPAVIKLYPVTGSGGRGVWFVQHRDAMDGVLNGTAAKLAKEQGELQPLLQEAITGSIEHVLHIIAHKGSLLRIYVVHEFNITGAIPPPDRYIHVSELPQSERVLAFVAWLCHATQLDGVAFIAAKVRAGGTRWKKKADTHTPVHGYTRRRIAVESHRNERTARDSKYW